MRPIYQTISVTATDVDVIAVAQAPIAAGNLTLTGTQPGGAQVISITSDDDDSGVDFTIYGTNANDNAISEVVTGPNTATVESTLYFKTVSRIAISDASTGNVSAGVVDEGAGPWIPMDYIQVPFNVGFGCVVTGTVDYTVQHAFDDPFVDAPTFTAFDNAFVAGETTNEDGNYAFPVRVIRLKINSGDGSVAFTVLQGLSA